MKTGPCCTGGGPSRPLARLSALLPGALVLLLPKCPLCLAAWLTVTTGIAVPAVAAVHLRGFVFWVVALVTVIYESAASVKRVLNPFRRRQAPTETGCDTLPATRTEDRATLESDPSVDPGAGIGGGVATPPRPQGRFVNQSWRNSGKLRGLGRSPRSPGHDAAAVITSLFESYSSSRSGLRSASEKSSIRSVRDKSFFVPGFAITASALKRQRTEPRAYPLLDEATRADVGSR